MLRWFMVLAVLGFSLDAGAQSDVWLQRCATALAQGRVNEVVQIYRQVESSAATPEQQVIVGASLGEALWRSGRLDEAEATLLKARQLLPGVKNPALGGEVALRLGQVAVAKDDSEAGVNWYRQALDIGRQTQQFALAAAAGINIYRQTQQESDLIVAQQLLTQIAAVEQTELKLTLAYAVMQAKQPALAEQMLTLLLAQTQNPRSRSQILGYLGQIAEQQAQYANALALTEQAIIADNAEDLLLSWQWQRGRILTALQQTPIALDAYRQAIGHLQSIKSDIPVNYQYGSSSFKTTYAPLYMALIELLWSEARQQQAQHQTQLNEILHYWEQLKAVELQDYFREACAVRQKDNIAAITEGTAVLYPIILPTRLLLLVRFKETIQAFETVVESRALRRTAQATLKQLFSALKGEEVELSSNRTLYQWVMQPIVGALQQRQIETLIYLPDGPLRMVPLSLFSDAKHYVLEKYKVVTVPGLSLLETTASQRSTKALLTGMSQPGPVIDELLQRKLNFLPTEQQESPNSRGLPDMRQLPVDHAERALRAQQMKSKMALPGVTVELKKLSSLLQVEALENEQFTLEAFKQKIAEGTSFVHIATHGYFAGDPKKSFVMTYDHLLDMQQMTQIFRNEAFLQHPVDLMTLSACQTAEGDERSPLGLSGVVVQTGVRSAIGTLWPVSDEAAREFFTDFYQHYQQPGVSKAAAMQTAQQHLLQNPVFKHPRDWAPFVLIGNWQ